MGRAPRPRRCFATEPARASVRDVIPLRKHGSGAHVASFPGGQACRASRTTSTIGGRASRMSRVPVPHRCEWHCDVSDDFTPSVCAFFRRLGCHGSTEVQEHVTSRAFLHHRCPSLPGVPHALGPLADHVPTSRRLASSHLTTDFGTATRSGTFFGGAASSTVRSGTLAAARAWRFFLACALMRRR